jgi:hypothetical protein
MVKGSKDLHERERNRCPTWMESLENAVSVTRTTSFPIPTDRVCASCLDTDSVATNRRSVLSHSSNVEFHPKDILHNERAFRRSPSLP